MKFIILTLSLLFLLFSSTLVAEMYNVEEIFTKHIDFGITLTTDVVFSSYQKSPGKYTTGPIDEDLVDYTSELDYCASELLARSMGYVSIMWGRVDFSAKAKLSPTTNLNSLIAFRVLDQDSGAQDDFSYTILKCEIEHLYNEMYKFRIGRLNEKYSQSRHFGRIALGKKDAHVFGRTPFINDAAEVSINSAQSNLPMDFAMGLKTDYMPITFTNFYLATRYEKKIGENKLNGFFIYTLNRQTEDELAADFPRFEGSRKYHGFETEVSYNYENKITSFLNMGFLANYIGELHHCSGPRDILKTNVPMIEDSDESISETFTPSFGIKVDPSKFNKKLSFFKEFFAEMEIVGTGYDKADIVNSYMHFRFMYKDLSFQYGIFMNNISFSEKTSLYDGGGIIQVATDELHNYVHYFRITTSF